MPRWRYHKMIITTTIWWEHNWLNIKNCSEKSLVDGGLFLLCKSRKISRKWSRRWKICSFVVKRISLSLPPHFLRCRNWHSIARYQRASNHSYTIRFFPSSAHRRRAKSEMKWKPYRDLIALVYWLIARVVKKAKNSPPLLLPMRMGKISSLVDIESTFPAKVNTLLLDCHC